MLLLEHWKRSQQCIVSSLYLGGNKKETARVFTCGLFVMSTSEVAPTALRHFLTGVRSMLCSLEPLSHLLKRCGINLATRITLAQDF